MRNPSNRSFRDSLLPFQKAQELRSQNSLRPNPRASNAGILVLRWKWRFGGRIHPPLMETQGRRRRSRRRSLYCNGKPTRHFEREVMSKQLSMFFRFSRVTTDYFTRGPAALKNSSGLKTIILNGKCHIKF